MKLQRTRFDEMKVIAMNIACEKSFEDALEYIYSETRRLNISSSWLWEELLNMDFEGVTLEMYKHILDKPYIYWLGDFMWIQREKAESISKEVPGILEKTYKEFYYWLYKKYSGEEIVERIVEFICEIANNNFSSAVSFFVLELNEILDVAELEEIWTGITKYYTEAFEKDYEIKHFLEDLAYAEKKNMVVYNCMMEFAIENFHKIIPYLDEWNEREKMKKVLLKEFKEKNSEDR